ncbi:unnamed protein product [Durusdinium trenchii]|uniref:Intron-binding protein aquarius n=1 Tax=Durusdinium trenchii TaxID=1381693 RepID=A0ABP0ICI7_9DINO
MLRRFLQRVFRLLEEAQQQIVELTSVIGHKGELLAEEGRRDQAGSGKAIFGSGRYGSASGRFDCSGKDGSSASNPSSFVVSRRTVPRGGGRASLTTMKDVCGHMRECSCGKTETTSIGRAWLPERRFSRIDAELSWVADKVLSLDDWLVGAATPATEQRQFAIDTQNSTATVIEEVYTTLRDSGFDARQVTTLEFNSFLERQLWPSFDTSASPAHLLTIALLINEKVRDGSVSAWDSIALRKEKFSGYFECMLELWTSGKLTLREKSHVLQFLINCFQSLEQEFVRDCCLRLTGLQSWFHLNDLHREKLLSINKKLPAFWKKVQKKYADPKTSQAKHERNFMAELLDEFLASLEAFGDRQLSVEELSYLERCIELMVDLLDQLPTRRFFRPLLVDKHIVVRCKRSKVAQLPEARLLNQLLGILRYYENFEIDDTTGKPLTRREVTDLHYDRLQLLQRVCFQEFPENPSLKQIMLINVANLDTREALLENFTVLPLEVLKVLCAKVCYLDVSKDSTLVAMEQKVLEAIAAQERLEAEKEEPKEPKKKKRKKKVKTEEEKRLCELLVEILVNRLERPVMQQDDVMKMPLYPTEDLIWDPNLVPEEHYSGDYSLALPKLNLQKENNFKAILHTIRSLMNNEDTVVPDWLHDLFLGYGDPGAAQYWKLPTALNEIDFRDLSNLRVVTKESFPDADDVDVPENLQRPFRLSFEKVTEKTEPGKPRENSIRFTPVQVEAIRSGVNPGLTMVVGPPGTGKTDTAVQVVNLLFHNFPDQKIVLVAHSNQALNDLFEKIVALDIPERYLLRLGRGIEELDAKQDFSKWGRVNHMLQGPQSHKGADQGPMPMEVDRLQQKGKDKGKSKGKEQKGKSKGKSEKGKDKGKGKSEGGGKSGKGKGGKEKGRKGKNTTEEILAFVKSYAGKREEARELVEDEPNQDGGREGGGEAAGEAWSARPNGEEAGGIQEFHHEIRAGLESQAENQGPRSTETVSAEIKAGGQALRLLPSIYLMKKAEEEHGGLEYTLGLEEKVEKSNGIMMMVVVVMALMIAPLAWAVYKLWGIVEELKTKIADAKDSAYVNGVSTRAYVQGMREEMKEMKSYSQKIHRGLIKASGYINKEEVSEEDWQHWNYIQRSNEGFDLRRIHAQIKAYKQENERDDGPIDLRPYRNTEDEEMQEESEEETVTVRLDGGEVVQIPLRFVEPREPESEDEAAAPQMEVSEAPQEVEWADEDLPTPEVRDPTINQATSAWLTQEDLVELKGYDSACARSGLRAKQHMLNLQKEWQKDVAYTCENAQHFFLHHVQYRWEDFHRKLSIAGKNGVNIHKVLSKPATKKRRLEEDAEAEGSSRQVLPFDHLQRHIESRNAVALLLKGETTVISLLFPFSKFFADAPQPLFPGDSYESDLEIAEGCFRYFENMFSEIEECRAFELLRNSILAKNGVQTFLRPSIAELYSWRYRDLGNLPNVLTDERYRYANAGLTYPYQFVNVEDFEGRGESQPTPYFYQNLGGGRILRGTLYVYAFDGDPCGEDFYFIDLQRTEGPAARCGEDKVFMESTFWRASKDYHCRQVPRAAE